MREPAGDECFVRDSSDVECRHVPAPLARVRSTVDNGREALERRPVVVESEEW
jgi:hypothetical protein